MRTGDSRRKREGEDTRGLFSLALAKATEPDRTQGHSIGQACKYCTNGKMRPIHFSWDQAVILCDNKKCKSILCASPSDCIIKKELLQYAQEPFSALDPPSLLSDGSGGSSSGIYSEARSSISSPAQSQKSITDEEVELLLKSSYSPLNFKNHMIASKHQMKYQVLFPQMVVISSLVKL
ncbi:hypothetical protein E2C01_015844 [Portunus trituberculatus]|uniref:Uncharacterized protein n=1 Tax=Portunus trituberculatus TaxID=210409 RepID=A0A5B7DNZ3_PORTR|nr:hypothetical protein [Portunus trituberculatus]